MADHFSFSDYSGAVKDGIREAAVAWLHEAAGEMTAQTVRNSRRATGQTAGSFEYKVDEGKYEAYTGSNMENAIWEEYGTGEYALEGKGRKGYWVYVKGGSGKSSSPKNYTLEEAKKVVASMRKKGLDAHYTKGKRPSRAMKKAYDSLKEKMIIAAQAKMKGLG